MRSLLAACLAAAFAAGLLSCRNDPAENDIIDALPAETGTPSATHRPGEPCLACHTGYQGAQPQMAVGGTIFGLDKTGTKVVPAPNIMVEILDSAQTTRRACTNEAGNFYILQDDWKDITYPLSPYAGGTQMISIVGRDGSCATCHKLPDKDSLDQITGRARDSAGVITVDATQVDKRCLTSAKDGGQ